MKREGGKELGEWVGGDSLGHPWCAISSLS